MCLGGREERKKMGASSMAKWVVPAAVGASLSLLTWRSRYGHREPFAEQSPTLFVSIASYRDTDCVNTLKNMFDNAQVPSRVFAGVCEQNTAAAAETCMPAEFRWHDQVRRVSIPSKEAKGPTYARYLCSTLYRGETYFCQLDSHMRFVKNWDTLLVQMIQKCPSSNAILTHYPHDYQQTATGIKDVPVLCKSKLDPGSKLATFEAVTLPASQVPKPVPFVAGGFFFGPGRLVTDVPYDPDLPHLFQGEELLYSARLWTSGYDFFTPTQNVVFHHYYRKSSPKFWEDLDYSAIQQATLDKVRGLLRGAQGYRYGMGSVRTLDQYWEYSKIDLGAGTFGSEAVFCV